MGKISATNSEVDVEVIPVDNNFSGRKSQPPQTPFQQSVKQMNRIPYMSDPTIVPRVQKYLEGNVHKNYIDINQMADDLQRAYREYAKRKRNAFRGAVRKAYSIVMKSYGSHPQTSSEEEISDESGEGERNFEEGGMENAMMGMYGYNQRPMNTPQEELIDISSDEDQPQQALLAIAKAKNGPSSSQKLPIKHPLLPAPGTPFSPAPDSIKSTNARDIRTPNQTEQPERAKKRKLEVNPSYPFGIAKKKRMYSPQVSSVNFSNVAGMDNVLLEINRLMEYLELSEYLKANCIDPPRGFLICGPPGCGKTLLANAIAGEYDLPLWKVCATELVGGISGESEERIRELFDSVLAAAPGILFIDEIDAITQNRKYAQKDLEKRIVSQLLSSMDDLNNIEEGRQVIVIGTTNRLDSIDNALRRSGRFDKEICIGMPDTQARLKILQLMTSKCKLADDVNLEVIAKNTPGYVGSDFVSLIREALIITGGRLKTELREIQKLEEAVALKSKTDKQKQLEEEKAANDGDKSDAEIIVDGDSKDKTDLKPTEGQEGPVVVIDDDIKQEKANGDTSEAMINDAAPEEVTPPTSALDYIRGRMKIEVSLEELNNTPISMDAFMEAMKYTVPTAKREGFATVPDTTWEDIGSLADIREELQMDILASVKFPKHSDKFGMSSPSGILLTGPPGCGKTLLAKAIANEAGINFIAVNGPELMNMYVGESERAVRACFERARNSAPCVIFFDEIDSICPKRSDNNDGVTSRVVNQLLTEMDGIKGRKQVFILAASNRPDVIDPAILRPGRFDKILYVGLPSSHDRVEILKTITKNGKKPELAEDVDLEAIGMSEKCKGYTGADLATLVKQAGREAFKDYSKEGDFEKPCLVFLEHFKRALAKIKPSVSEKDQKTYDQLKKMYSLSKEEELEEMELS